MPVPECPICHARASLAGQQPYCVKCGWNRDIAIAALRRGMRMLPLGMAMFFAFILFFIFAGHFRNPVQLAVFFAVAAIGLPLNYFVMRNRLAKLKAMQTECASSATNAAAAESNGAFGSGSEARDARAIQPDPKYQALASAPRPRPIRMAKRGRINITVGLIAAVFFGGILGSQTYVSFARTRSFATFGPKDWLITGLAVLILLIPYGMWRAQVRECDLLQNGEIAEGRVTGQWVNNNTSSIAYEFTDFRGNKHTGSGYDYTKKLNQGMAVPVFYDTNNSKRQIAYCSTFHEIVV